MGSFRSLEAEKAWNEFCSSVLERSDNQFELYSRYYSLQNGKELPSNIKEDGLEF